MKLAINILKKPLKNRGNSDIKLLKKCFEKIQFFEDISKDKGGDIIENLCLNLNHKYIKEGECIFKEGSIILFFHKKNVYLYIITYLFTLGSYGTTFYIILKGSVSVIKKEVYKFGDPQSPSAKMNKGKSFRRKKTMAEEEDHEIVEVEVKVLEKGQSFGELALLENKPRQATLVCKENSHFATLEKQFFDQILSNFKNLTFPKKDF